MPRRSEPASHQLLSICTLLDSRKFHGHIRVLNNSGRWLRVENPSPRAAIASSAPIDQFATIWRGAQKSRLPGRCAQPNAAATVEAVGRIVRSDGRRIGSSGQLDLSRLARSLGNSLSGEPWKMQHYQPRNLLLCLLKLSIGDFLLLIKPKDVPKAQCKEELHIFCIIAIVQKLFLVVVLVQPRFDKVVMAFSNPGSENCTKILRLKL